MNDLNRRIEKICASCGGAGKRVYGNTATWHKDQEISGQAFTCDICDRCWGSGDDAHPWLNLYELVRGSKPAPAYTPEDVSRLVEAARLTVQLFSRKNLYPEINFMGDDEHEAWSALGAALAPFKVQS